MERPRRLLTKLELGIEVGYIKIPLELERAYRLYQAENAMRRDYKNDACTYAQDPWLGVIRNLQYKDNAKKISHRVDKIIHSIMNKEENQNILGTIKKNDMLKPIPFENPIKILDFGDFPKKEYNPGDIGYDRNQFIRSYFRYKGYTVEKGHLKVKRKQIDLENESLDACKITLPIIIFSKLYSFDEITEKVFSFGIIRNKKTKEILKIDFPLTPTIIEKVASKYGIEPIIFEKSEIKYKYLFKTDLLYLDENVPCLKFRNLTITHNISCTLTDEARNNVFQSTDAKQKYLKEKKMSYHPRLRQVIWRKANTGKEKDSEVIRKIWEANSLEHSEELFTDPKNLSTLSFYGKADIIEEFFKELPKSDKVCVMYETPDDILAQIGYAKYDENQKSIIINGCTISTAMVIGIYRMKIS